MLKLISNKIRCKFCGDVIESRSVHDFVWCRCGKCSTDGGQEYAQRSFATEKPEDTYEDLSTYVDTETGKIFSAKDANKEEVPFKPIRVEINKVEVPDEPSSPTLDISEVTEAVEAEPVNTSEERAKRNEDKNQKKAEQVARIKELKAEGKSFNEISKELELPESTVRQYFKQN